MVSSLIGHRVGLLQDDTDGNHDFAAISPHIGFADALYAMLWGRPESLMAKFNTKSPTVMTRACRLLLVAVTVAVLMPSVAQAVKVSNPVAVFVGLDKVTGRITRFDVYMDETVQFGALQITPRVCYSRTPEEAQRITTFVEIDQVTLKKQVSRIFTGWMFEDSPALSAVDHPVYDVWLVNCKQTSDVPPPSN